MNGNKCIKVDPFSASLANFGHYKLKEEFTTITK